MGLMPQDRILVIKMAVCFFHNSLPNPLVKQKLLTCCKPYSLCLVDIGILKRVIWREVSKYVSRLLSSLVPP